MARLAALVFLAASAFVAEAVAPGALKLDNYTFDKILAVQPGGFLVKFDRPFAFGEKEDEFKQLCKLAYLAPDFLIGEVAVQEYGDKENDDLRERFGVPREEFPAFFFFDRANPKGRRYTGEVNAADLAAWLQGFQIRMPSLGTIQGLDEMVYLFLKEDQADRHIETTKSLAEGVFKTDRKAPMYVKIMQKFKEKGESYVTGETARITKLMEGKLPAEKKSELIDKLRVLAVFAKASRDVAAGIA